MPTPPTSLDDAGRLEELRALQLLATPIEPEFDNLTQLASEICDAPVALISFVDQDQIWFKSRVGFDALHSPRKDAFCSHAIQGAGPLVVEDATADPRFQDNVYVQAPQGIRFYAGIPLVLSSGHAVGTLCVIDHKARTLSDKQLGSLKKLALQVTALIEAKRTGLRLQDEDRNRLVIEQRLDFALQSADIGDWDMDLRTNVARRSLKHDQCFGYTEAVPQWGYDTFLAHVVEADRARVDGCYQRAMAGLGAYDVEFRVFWPDQTLHWLWSKGRFYFDEAGKPYRVAGIQVDITARKQTEESLRHTQALLANAEKIGRVGGWEIDVQTLQTTWTEAVYDIYELDSTDRLTVDEGVNYYTPESRPIIEQAVQHAIEQGEPFDLELEIISAKGNRRSVHAVGKPDRARGKVSGFFQDITEQKQAADVLRVSELALQAISQAVMIAGPDQLITSVNAGFTAITGYSAAEVLGRNFKFLQGPDTDPETVAAISAALRRPAEFAGEILNYRKDGTVFWNDLTIAPVLDVHGTLAHFIGITRDISTRRAAELQLRLQGSQLAQADTLAGLGRWDWNLTDHSASWSDGLYRIYGRDPADGVPAFDDWQETIHPEDKARLAQCIQTALAGASAYHVEFRIFTKDTGQLRYVESRGSSVVDANGKPTNIWGVDWDITERKLAELALKGSNAQLQLLETCVSRLNDIVLITEAEPFSEPGPRIVFVNDAFVRRTGFSREEVIGKSPRLLQGPKTDRKELDRIRAALEHWQPVRSELINYTKAGQEFWLELDIVPVADATGWYTHWIAVERDITERKQTQDALRASEARRKIAMDSGRVAVWEIDLKTNHLVWDDTCFDLYQIRKEDFDGSFDAWSGAIHPQDLDALVQAFQNAVAGIGKYDPSFRIVWPDGTVRYIQSHAEVLHDKDGIPDRVIGTNWDITEQKVNEQALKSSVQEKSALLKELHHRVKNNLQVITSLLRLESRRSAVPEAVDVLKAMQGRIHAMAQLHASLYRSGTLASVDLGVYLGQIATQAFQAQVLEDKRVRLRLTMGSVPVGMDQAVAGGLLVNELVSNCLKHGFAGARSGEVHVDLQPEDAAAAPTEALWRLRVSDTGVGLPSDFEAKRKISLGLILAEDLSQQLGGTLTVQSQPGVGTEFSVVFKALEPAALVMPV